MQFQGDIEEDKFDTIYQAVGKSYDADTIYVSLETYFLENYNEEMIDSLLEWASSKLFQKILKLQEADPADQEVNEYYSKFIANPENYSRLRQIDNSMENSEAFGLAIKSYIYLHETYFPVINSILPEDVRLNSAQINNGIQQIEADVTSAQFKEGFIKECLYAYRDLSDKDLETYYRFYDNKVGKWSSDFFAKAFQNSLREAAIRLKRRLSSFNLLNDSSLR